MDGKQEFVAQPLNAQLDAIEYRIRSRQRYSRMPSSSDAAVERPRAALAITTYNRSQYLSRLLETFLETRSDEFEWIWLVADDGSTDGSRQVPIALATEQGIDCIVVRNQRAGIARQTNSLLLAASAVGFDFGFKVDDDVFFKRSGWDVAYKRATEESGFDHLVFHDPSWKPARHQRSRGSLASHVDALSSMGCFWTFTPELIAAIGLFDEDEFPIRGHSHIDYTVRACRAGRNEREHLWDLGGATEFVGLWPRDGYVETFDWRGPEAMKLKDDAERTRRYQIIEDGTRSHVIPAALTEKPRFRVSVHGPRRQAVRRALSESGHFSVSVDSDPMPPAFVLNLGHEPGRWAVTASVLARSGLEFERFPATNGYSEAQIEAWEVYASAGLTLPLERRINRKLIGAPGAWGYLSSVERLLERAIETRLEAFVLFDDDVRPHVDAARLLRHAWSEVPSSWKLLYFGANQRSWKGARVVSPHLYRPGSAPDGSYAVAIDSTVFQPLLEHVRRRSAPFDSGPLGEVHARYPDDVYVLRPNAFIPDVSTSSIRGERDVAEMAKAARWDLDDYLPRAFPSVDTTVSRSLPRNGLVTLFLLSGAEAPRDLWASLESLRHQEYGNFELYVVQDGAEEGLRSTVLEASRRDARVRGYRAEGLTGADLLNAVIADRSPDLLAVLPAGSICTPGLLLQVVERVNASGGDGVRVPAIVAPTLPSGFDVQHFLSDAARARRAAPYFDLPFVPRAAFDVVGGLRDVGAAGIADWCERLTMRGVALHRTGIPSIVVQARGVHRVDEHALVKLSGSGSLPFPPVVGHTPIEPATMLCRFA